MIYPPVFKMQHDNSNNIDLNAICLEQLSAHNDGQIMHFRSYSITLEQLSDPSNGPDSLYLLVFYRS